MHWVFKWGRNRKKIRPLENKAHCRYAAVKKSKQRLIIKQFHPELESAMHNTGLRVTFLFM